MKKQPPPVFVGTLPWKWKVLIISGLWVSLLLILYALLTNISYAQTTGPSPTPGPILTATPDPVVFDPAIAGQVRISKSVQPAQAPIGTLLTYTIIVQNTGARVNNVVITQDVQDVVITDNVPDGLQVISVNVYPIQGIEPIFNGQHVEVHIPSLSPEEVVTIIIVVRIGGNVLGGQVIHNIAQVHYRGQVFAPSTDSSNPVSHTEEASASATGVATVLRSTVNHTEVASVSASSAATVLQSDLPRVGSEGFENLLKALGLLALATASILLGQWCRRVGSLA